MVRTARKPGVRFVAVRPPETNRLPRMDVAAFVGFARSGPLHTPVAVESFEQFDAIFGAAIRLPTPMGASFATTSYLAPSVRAYFENGGRRCWIVRVAAPTPPVEIPVPGLARVSRSGGVTVVEPAFARARSPGRWGLALRAATTLDEVGGIRLWPVIGSPPAPGWTPSTFLLEGRTRMTPGDLIRIRSGGTSTYVVASRVGRLDVPVPATSGVELSEYVELDSGTGAVLHDERPSHSPSAPITSASYGATLQHSATVVDGPYQARARPGEWMLDLLTNDEGPSVGHLLRVDAPPGALLLSVTVRRTLRTSPASPSANAVRVFGRGAWLDGVVTPDIVLQSGTGPYDAARLTFALYSRDEHGTDRIDDLAFDDRHPRAWSKIPTDATRYALHPRLDAERSALESEARERAFDLAGPPDAAPRTYLPVGMDLLATHYVGAEAIQDPSRLDGLDSFEPSLFLGSDGILTGQHPDRITRRAEQMRSATPQPVAFQGIFTLLDVDEATLIAVPDAVHQKWQPRRAPSEPPPAVEAIATADGTGSAFRDCDVLDPPRIAAFRTAILAGTPASLTWVAIPHAAGYELQESLRNDFVDAVTHAVGATSFSVVDHAPGDYFYRARARNDRGAAGPWSAPVGVRIMPPLADEPAAIDLSDLRRIHTAVLRLCAGRGDLFAVLSLPVDVPTKAALDHRAALERPVEDRRDDRVASYGALYHPWLVSTDARRYPPDGAALGLITRRSIEVGPWAPAANRAFRQSVALSPRLAPRDLEALHAAGVNVVREEPSGFLTLSATTTTAGRSYAQINVRRLMILLRLLAMERGAALVFEPNGDRLRRQVQRRFVGVLQHLFERGAFAGATPAESFRLAVEAPVGRPGTPGEAMVEVDISVAPSLPLQFLTVRMSQSIDAATAVEEV